MYRFLVLGPTGTPHEEISMTFFTLVSRLRVFGFVAIVLLTGTLLGCASGGSEQGSDAFLAGVQAHPDHPHYLSWGDTPIYPLGATAITAGRRSVGRGRWISARR
jgi:hypothetical protein